MKIAWSRACVLAACLSIGAGCGKADTATYVKSAKGYLAKGQYDSAAIELKNALKLSPENGEVRYLLARTFLLGGDYAGAVTEARKALSLKYSPDDACTALGAALLRQREYSRVTGEIPKCGFQSTPARAEANAMLATAYLGLGDAKHARLFADKALAQQDDNVRARIADARLKAAGGDLEGGLKLVDSVVTQAPSDTDALMLKAELEQALGRNEDARRTFTLVTKVNPALVAPRVALIMDYLRANEVEKAEAEVSAIKKMAPADPQAHFLDAVVLLKRGNYAAARDAVQKARQGAPDYLPAQFVAGLIDSQLGNLRTAEDSLRGVVSKAPGHDAARRALAAVQIRSGRADQALEVLEPAFRRASDNPANLKAMGEAYVALGQPAKATEYLDRATALGNNDVRGRIRVAQVRLAAGDAERALQELEALSASQPDNQSADMALITALLQRREFDRALAAATAFEQKQPKNPAGPNSKGIVYLAKGDLANARANFNKALALDPEFATAAANLAQLEVFAGNPGEARKRYEELLKKYPKNEQYLLALSQLMAAMNAAPAEVVAVLDRAIAADRTSPRPHLALLRYLTSRKDWTRALAAAQAAQTAIPNNPAVLEAVASAQIAAGETNLGVQTMRQAVRLQPGAVEPLVRLAEVQVRTKDYDGALASLHSALTLQPNNLEIWSAVATTYVRAGRIEAGLGEAKKLKQNASRAEGWVVEGDLLAAQRKWAEAVAAYKAASEKKPSTITIVKLQSAQMAANQPKDALATARRWLKEHPEDQIVRMRLGQQLIALKDYPAAIAELKVAANAAPNNIEALNNLAWAMSEAGDPKAVETAARAYALAPSSSAITNTYGWVLVQHGDVKRGVDLLRQAVQLSPDDPVMRLYLARGLIKAGDKAAAKVELEGVVGKAAPQSSARADAEKLLKEL